MGKQTFFCFNATLGTLHKVPISIVVQHLMFLYGWQWNAAQQHAQKGLLHFHCNNGYAKMPQCYVICIQSIILVCHCDWTTQGTPEMDYNTQWHFSKNYARFCARAGHNRSK